MKTAPNNSALDAFVKETLKSADEIFQPFDWSEIEVLLRHEPRSISVDVNKKTMLIAGAVAGVLMLSFGIFKIAQHYSSLPAEPDTLTADSTQNTFSLLDTTTIDSSAFKADAPKVDSTAFFAAQKHKADSLAALAAADSIAKIKTDIAPVVKIKDKKKKADTTQKAAILDTVASKAAMDTASKLAPKEVRIETPAVQDTANKKVASLNTGGKKKKTKAKNTPPPPVEQKTDPPVAPQDSLK